MVICCYFSSFFALSCWLNMSICFWCAYRRASTSPTASLPFFFLAERIISFGITNNNQSELKIQFLIHFHLNCWLCGFDAHKQTNISNQNQKRTKSVGNNHHNFDFSFRLLQRHSPDISLIWRIIKYFPDLWPSFKSFLGASKYHLLLNCIKFHRMIKFSRCISCILNRFDFSLFRIDTLAHVESFKCLSFSPHPCHSQ